MAYLLKKGTAIDPLTVDQVTFSERSSPEFEHPLRLELDRRGLLLDKAAILLDSNNTPLPLDPHVDESVISPRTRYQGGRPTWMDMAGRRRPITVNMPTCIDRTSYLRRAAKTSLKLLHMTAWSWIIKHPQYFTFLPTRTFLSQYLMSINDFLIGVISLLTPQLERTRYPISEVVQWLVIFFRKEVTQRFNRELWWRGGSWALPPMHRTAPATFHGPNLRFGWSAGEWVASPQPANASPERRRSGSAPGDDRGAPAVPLLAVPRRPRVTWWP